MASVTVKIIGADKFVRNQFSLIKRISEDQLERIAQDTETEIKGQVEQTTTRANSTGNLKNSMFAEETSTGWGIGNISFLNTNAPYWRHVNFGSEAIGADRNFRVPTGAFQPGGSAPSAGNSSQRWQVGSGKFSFSNPDPIAPRNYIQRTLAQIPRIINKNLSRSI